MVLLPETRGQFATRKDEHWLVGWLGLAKVELRWSQPRRLSPEGRGTEIAGTPPFMSPEAWCFFWEPLQGHTWFVY